MRDREGVKGKMVKRKKPPIPLPVEGWPRPYVRDGVPGLPMERQEEILSAIGLDLSDEKAYRDHLSRAKLRKRGALPQYEAGSQGPEEAAKLLRKADSWRAI